MHAYIPSLSVREISNQYNAMYIYYTMSYTITYLSFLLIKSTRLVLSFSVIDSISHSHFSERRSFLLPDCWSSCNGTFRLPDCWSSGNGTFRLPDCWLCGNGTFRLPDCWLCGNGTKVRGKKLRKKFHILLGKKVTEKRNEKSKTFC